MAFDGRCYELAQAALSDERVLNREDMRCLLAQFIQTSVEKWVMMEREIAGGAGFPTAKPPLPSAMITRGEAGYQMQEPAAIRIAELRAEIVRLNERIRELGNAQKSRFFNARDGRGDLDRLETENAQLRARLKEEDAVRS
jgi:hypothetical protein